MKKLASLFLVVSAIFLLSGFSPLQAVEKNVIMATTTSTQDSGLLDALLPVFEKKTGYFVKTIAVGSGQAMAMGQKGEADVLLVHSPAAEQKFIKEGYGVNRRLVMHNDFIVVGPASDPAKIKGHTKEIFRLFFIKGPHYCTEFISGAGQGPHTPLC
jgi:tungstate transport system substrate-binding protein